MFVVFIIVRSFEMMGSAPWQRVLLDVNATRSPHVRRHGGYNALRAGDSPVQGSALPSCRESVRLRWCPGVGLVLPICMSLSWAMTKIALSMSSGKELCPLGVGQDLSWFLPERAVPHLEHSLFQLSKTSAGFWLVCLGRFVSLFLDGSE